MAREPGVGFFTLNPRRRPTVIPVQPGVQLKLPITILLVTVAFVGLLAWHSQDIFGRVFEFALREVSQKTSRLAQYEVVSDLV